MRNRIFSLLVLFLFGLGVAGCGGSSNAENAPSGEISWTEVDANGLTFRARVAGPESGELVILLHGFPSTSAQWLEQLRALGEAGYRVFAPDQRGYSPQARPTAPGSYALSNLSADVLAMADALGRDRFHLVGHDWGAAVTWYVGRFSPERLYSLTALSVPHLDAFVLTGSDPSSCQFEASSYINFFVQPGSQDVLLANDAAILRGIWTSSSEEAVAEYLDLFREPGVLKLALDWYRQNSLTGGGELIGKVIVPTMYIWSTEDTALCRDPAYLTGDYVDGPYQFSIIEGVDHWVTEAAPDEVSELLLAHLAEFSAD
jgi:pimeloyl-ACP methyl ester carboxylesterase